MESTSPEILSEAENATDSLLPSKSKEKYMVAYDNFLVWKNTKNEKSFSENVFLAYFHEMANNYKPSSLWCMYSMLKSTVRTKNDIDIKTYTKLTEFIKSCSVGFKSQKSKVLSSNDVEKFIKEAPDSQYLATKVALIFGITGACRCQELTNITTKDIENHGEILLVKITKTKNKIPRSFTIHGEFYNIVKKYEALRSENAKSHRFFQNFLKGKCTSQPIGINKFGSMPKEIAKFLRLPDADCYTGHCFRRTSATLLANTLSFKCQSGLKSNTVTDSYVEDPIRNKTSAQITQTTKLEPPPKKLCPELRHSTSDDNVLELPKPTNDASHICEPTRISAEMTQAIKLEPSAMKFNPDLHSSTTYDNCVFSDESQIYENLSISPTFAQDPISETFNNTSTHTVRTPSKTITYHFNNCTFKNCFNK